MGMVHLQDLRIYQDGVHCLRPTRTPKVRDGSPYGIEQGVSHKPDGVVYCPSLVTRMMPWTEEDVSPWVLKPNNK